MTVYLSTGVTVTREPGDDDLKVRVQFQDEDGGLHNVLLSRVERRKLFNMIAQGQKRADRAHGSEGLVKAIRDWIEENNITHFNLTELRKDKRCRSVNFHTKSEHLDLALSQLAKNGELRELSGAREQGGQRKRDFIVLRESENILNPDLDDGI